MENPIIGPASIILIVLLRYGEMIMSDIIVIAHLSRQAVFNNVRDLLEIGLVAEKREEGFPPRCLISFTDKGRKVAEKLEEIEKIL
ncbi:MAG: winged helix-turn-helix transcriptional regulator [Candidatus Methanomethylicaceae archaeon]